MTSSSLAPLVSSLRRKRDARPQDVLALRLAVFDDASVSQTDAEALMALDECMSRPCLEWRAFFVEALTDFIVRQEQPRGTVDPANARWLMRRITRDATVKPNELELFVRILETATSVPPELQKFTLKQVRHSVLFGESRNIVSDREVEILRRTLFASGHDRVTITRDEADILFDIAHATRDSANAASWADFFAKAVVNLLMAAKGYTAPSREVALRRGRWLSDQTVDPVSFAGRVVAALSNGLLANYSLMEDRAVPADTGGEGIVAAAEAEWLTERVKKDGTLSEIEKIMLERIRAEASSLHPTLQPLFEWAA